MSVLPELCSLLESTRSRLSPSTISLVTASKEVLTLIVDPRVGDSIQDRQKLESAIKDFRDSLDTLGEATRRSIEREIDAAWKSIKDLKRTPKSRRKNAAPKVQNLCGLLADPEIASATWQDVVDSLRDPDEPTVKLVRQLDLLRDLITESGRSATRILRLIRGILEDQGFTVQMAKAELGEKNLNNEMIELRDAGLSENERLSLSQKMLSSLPRRGHHVVWIGISGLRPMVPFPNGGPMRLVHSSALRMYRDNEMLHTLQTPELASSDAGVIKYAIADSDIYLMRVDLGNSRFRDPVSEAAERCRYAIESLLFETGTQQWSQTFGYIHAIDGHVTSWVPFRESSNEIAKPWPSRVSGSMTRWVSQAVSTRTPEFESSMSDLHEWHQIEFERDPSIAVSRCVSIIEHCASRMGSSNWFDFTKGTFLDTVIFESTCTRIDETAKSALRLVSGMAHEDRSKLVELKKAVTNYPSANPELPLDIPSILDNIDAIAELKKTDKIIGRSVRNLARDFTSVKSTSEYYRKSRELITTRLKRIRRVRNTATHLGSVDPEVSSSILDLSRRLAQIAIEIDLRRIASGKDAETCRRDFQRRADTWRESLTQASTLSDIKWHP